MTRIATTISLGLALAVGLSSCAEMTPTQRRAATGTLGGAAGGAALGAIAGNAGMGAGIGAGVGLLGGLLYDHAYEKGRRDSTTGR
jgi:hypothetical protein